MIGLKQILVFAAIGAALAACGVRGNPQPPAQLTTQQ
jgi:predicted small lipoprotein YifL